MISYQDVILFILSKANQKVYATFKSKMQPYSLTPIQDWFCTRFTKRRGFPPENWGSA
jgi:hypothetical protein